MLRERERVREGRKERGKKRGRYVCDGKNAAKLLIIIELTVEGGRREGLDLPG